MNAKGASTRKELSRSVVTEAAAWVARLHSPLRTAAVERGFRNWLAAAPDHVKAFELVTESWDEVATLRSGAQIAVSLRSDHIMPGGRRHWVPAAVAAGLAAIVIAAGALYFGYPSGVTTGVGEQRLVTLDDGTRVYLNTSTRMFVRYDRMQRHIRLDAGEALFEVAKDAGRPFTVAAGERRVQALGTTFVVRRDSQTTAVTLIEGKVAISDSHPDPASSMPPLPSNDIILSPGQRLTLAKNQVAAVDRPAMEKLTAWRRGKVSIENLSLADAVAEMNRYSRIRLAVERSTAAKLRVSGIFQVGDSLSFARAVSDNYGLTVEVRDREIVLTGGVP